jgi:hypothetical protein
MKKTLLLSLIITAGCIGLLETGVIQFNKYSFLAQQNIRNLVLERDSERVTIPRGDWVVAVDSIGKNILASGKLVGWNGLTVTIKTPNDIDKNISAQMIGNLYHGEARRLWYYTKSGMKRGGLFGLVVGLIWGSSTSVGGCGEPATRSEALILGPTFISMFTIPGGGLIGFFNGLVRDGKATKYIIGNGEWEIVFE